METKENVSDIKKFLDVSELVFRILCACIIAVWTIYVWQNEISRKDEEAIRENRKVALAFLDSQKNSLYSLKEEDRQSREINLRLLRTSFGPFGVDLADKIGNVTLPSANTPEKRLAAASNPSIKTVAVPVAVTVEGKDPARYLVELKGCYIYFQGSKKRKALPKPLVNLIQGYETFDNYDGSDQVRVYFDEDLKAGQALAAYMDEAKITGHVAEVYKLSGYKDVARKTIEVWLGSR